MPETVVVVGGTSGMGLATAQNFVRQGYHVKLTGRNESKVAEAVRRVNAAGTVLDFTSQESVERAFAGFGAIDHLVLVGSGAPARGAVRDLDAAAFQRALDEKFVGYHRCLRAALATLNPRGSVTVVTGGASRAAIPGTSLVAGINAGLQAWALVLAKELAPLRVNVLSPGFIDTPLHDWQPSDAKQRLFERLVPGIPVGRIGQPDEIADAAFFLATNAYVSGAVLDVDGGVRLR